jgi:hypothetical protein
MVLRSWVKSVSENALPFVVGLDAAHHSLPPPVVDDPLRHRRSWAVEAIERAGGDVAVELGAVEGGAVTEAVEHRDRQATGIGLGLQHQWRHGADEHRLGHTALAMLGDVADDLTAAGRVPDMDGVAQVEMIDDGRGVGGVVVHVVAVGGLGRAAVTASVVSNNTVAA